MEKGELEGETLGQKHQRFNKLVQEAVESQRTVNADNFNLENDNYDIINLCNIDIASHNKDIKYLLKVLCCDDMLYVSRAIKQSNWLINDQSSIVNPQYLSQNIYPYMNSKAKCKFIKHIRNNLRDEKRAEQFYNHEENPKDAVKWLPSCSLQFIENNVIEHVQHIKPTLLRRLCEKSIAVLEIYIINKNIYDKRKAFQTNMFLLKSNTKKYLDMLETVKNYEFPSFNKKATGILMKNCSDRIIDKFEMYHNSIHLPTFIEYLKYENIKDFILCQAQKEKITRRVFNLERCTFFIKFMPQDTRFDFVKKVFIDKNHELEENYSLSEKEKKGINELREMIATIPFYHEHIWYQFAPFKVALHKVKDMLRTASNPEHKESLLGVLLLSAQHNIEHERTILEYFRNIHINMECHIKEGFLKNLLSQNSFLNYDSDTWAVLYEIFKSMDIYTESENEQYFTEAIILYKVLHEETVPDIIEKKFIFNPLISYHKKLSEIQRTMLFNYLYSFITAKLAKCDTQCEKQFSEKLYILEQVLNLLKCFKQELEEYPAVIGIIKDLVKIKINFSWTVSMEKLFNIKKTWRKLLFEESLTICPTESSLTNALKHGPYLLEHNKRLVQHMLCDEKMPLKRVLGKIKIYWPNSLTENLKVTYTEKLNIVGSHKTATRGLCILMTRKNLQELIEQYAPKEARIDWSKIDEVELSLQQQFAKNMLIARPQPRPETILLFAKGDYLRYALPSLLSIFYNLSSVSSQKYIPTLLNFPVSLQKHGIRLAVSKMDIEELLHHFSNIWKSNSNATIRSVMFKNVFESLCKEKNIKKIQAAWGLLEMFIDNLTFQEDKAIYKLLFEVEKVPSDVRGCFYMKSYNFLYELLKSESKIEEYEYNFYINFTEYSIEILDQLHPSFIAGIIREFVENIFIKKRVNGQHNGRIRLISSYLLFTDNEVTQLERFDNILLPIIKEFCISPNEIEDEECFLRYNLKVLLDYLRCDVQTYVIDKKSIIPRTMFSLIRKKFEEPIPENYMLLTKWKLTASFIDILYAHKPVLNWEETCNAVASEFGNKCNVYLKEDCNKYYPSIYLLFGKALQSMLENFISSNAFWDIYKCFIQDQNFIQGYLITMSLLYHTHIDDEKNKSEEILKVIVEHPSTEIKIHCYNKIHELLGNQIE